MKIVVSACLAGISCRYNGKANTVDWIRKLYEQGLVLAVCPECLGGLSVPRVPCEIAGDYVLSREGQDCTQNFRRGAFLALLYARMYGAGFAILKAKSPSCGLGAVYDGTFSKKLVNGNGIFARMLLDNNFFVCTEKDIYIDKLREMYLAVYGRKI